MFSVYMALMLFQTNYLRLGTILAFGTLFLTLFFAIIDRQVTFSSRAFPKVNWCLIAFLVIAFFVSEIHYGVPDYYFKLVAQAILCIALWDMRLNEREERFLLSIYVVSVCIYGLLILYAVSQSVAHSRIVLFNTTLDPNFIGIPFSTASIIVLHQLITGKKRFLKLIALIFAYLVMILTIVSTASRGTFVGLVVSSIMLLTVFIFQRRLSFLYKLMVIIVMILLGTLLLRFVTTNYLYAWNRIINFGEGADNGRIDLWKAAILEWEEHPLLGIGLQGMYRGVSGVENHNTFVQILCETGVIGAFLVFPFLSSIIRIAYRRGYQYVCMFIALLLQIAFLDAIDNRCVWIVICWINMLRVKDTNAGLSIDIESSEEELKER